MYYYLLDKHSGKVFEFKPLQKTLNILKSMGIKCYDHFPYEEAGFEDPYTFMDNYDLIKLKEDDGSLILEESAE